MRIKAEDVKPGDNVLRFGYWFEVESVEKLPAERGGFLYCFDLKPSKTRLPRGYNCGDSLFPEESITVDEHTYKAKEQA